MIEVKACLKKGLLYAGAILSVLTCLFLLWDLGAHMLRETPETQLPMAFTIPFLMAPLYIANIIMTFRLASRTATGRLLKILSMGPYAIIVAGLLLEGIK